MREYSEDNLGARALNWIVIGGAAALFLLVSWQSLAPQSPEPPHQTVGATVSPNGHA